MPDFFIIDFQFSKMYIQCIYINTMTTKIQKWGNSLALRIPRSYLKEIKLKEGAAVDLKLEKNKIIITSKKKKKKRGKRKFTLEELVSKITPENRYEEIDFGPSVGKEIF